MTTDAAMDIALEVDAEAVSQLRREGLGMSKMTSSTNDAFRMLDVYHAYDGRKIRVPVYLVDPTEGASLLKRVFTREDKDAPPEFVGKRVWHLGPQPKIRPEGKYRCPFSVFNDTETKVASLEEGFESNCRKDTLFPTKFEVDNHVKLKHPKRYIAKAKFELEKNAEKQTATANVTNEALMVLVQKLLEQNAAPKGKTAPKPEVE